MLEVAKNIYCFPIPFRNSPLRELNGFVIKGENRHLMVDVGFNLPEGYEAVTKAFTELGISLKDTDIFLTHMHADHTGLVEQLKKECGKIYISERDGYHVNRTFNEEYWEKCMHIQDHMGFPYAETLPYQEHPAFIGGVQTHTSFENVTEGMSFSYGGYDFEAIDLKGHTPGQMGLYDKNAGILFSGDHILERITPNINLWDFEQDYLGLFLENLKKVKTLNVKRLFSGHRALVSDANKRIDELIAHHDERLNYVLKALADGKTTVYEVAMELKWNYGGGYFGDFPAPQKWFSASEVFTHLEHLRRIGKVNLTIDGLTYKYTVA